MDDWDEVPVFGVRPVGARCTIRLSAYALVRDDSGRLAVVQTSQGTFLPGGGLEAGEEPEDAIVREALEECALVVEPRARIARAIEVVYSTAEQMHFEKRSIFVEAVLTGTSSTKCEPDHALLWVAVEQAVTVLTNQSHRWAVKQGDPEYD